MPGTLYDFAVFGIFLFGFLVVWYSLSLRKESSWRKFFYFGAVFKVIMGALMGLVFLFYYKHGDTLNFFKYGVEIQKILLQDPSQFNNIFLEGNHSDYDNLYYVIGENPSFVFMKNIAGAFSFPAFNSYLVVNLFISLLSFAGVWYLYKRLATLYPHAKESLGWVMFFIPSVVFWTSGLLKDAVIMGALGFYIGALIDIFKLHKSVIKKILLLLISAFIIYRVKSYVSVLLLASTGVFIIAHYVGGIKSKPLKLGLYSLSGIGVVFGLLLFGATISQFFTQILIEEFIGDALSKQHGMNYIARESSSSYQIGLDLYKNPNVSMTTLLGLLPISVVTTLFRPFVWEAHKAIIMISAIENLFILALSAYVLFKVGIFRFFKYIFSDSFLLFLFVFVIAFAFTVGLATGNFGALSRYRTPCMGLYFPLLFIIYSLKNQAKHAKRIHH